MSVFDRGFLYGDSVFEVLRTYGGRPFALVRHLERLEASAARVFIEPVPPRATLVSEVERAIAASGNAESYVRLMLTRGIGQSLGLDPELSRAPLRVLIVTELTAPPAALYEQGIGAITLRAPRVTDHNAGAGAKVGNYLTAVLAQREARKAGAAEALLVTADDRVLEGSTSNVFAVIEGELITPPASDGILLGITRETVLTLARERGLTARERSLSLAELKNCQEAFISSSIRELVPLVTLDGASLGGGKPGALTQELLRQFRTSCRASVGLAPS